MKLIRFLVSIFLFFLCTCSFPQEDFKHEYVDLKLPSGLLWATYNIGANSLYEYGDYFSWGEVQSKTNYGIETYKWYSDQDGYKLNKYCLNADYGSVDGKTVLENSDDAACSVWGKGWRMPTKSELMELLDGCNWYVVRNYNNLGISGRLGISKVNGDSIFFPVSGHKFLKYTEPLAIGNVGCVWTSSNSDNGAYQLCFDLEDFIDVSSVERSCGCPIRAVRLKK